MSEEKQELAVPENVPTYLTEYQGETGTEELAKFVKPPRLKVVQKTADDSLHELFNVGDLIVTPAMLKVAEMGEVFQFAPLYFFPEWCKWNPYELKGTLPMIAERTFDPNNPLVALCRNESTREFEWPEPVNGKTVFGRNVEHLNFVIEIMSGPCAGMVAIQSFFRAQHQDGQNFNQLIKMRSNNGTRPLVAMQFEAKTYFKSFGGNSWYGLQAMNPSTIDPWASEEDFERRRLMRLEFKEAHEMGQIQVDHDENTVEGEVVEETKFLERILIMSHWQQATFNCENGIDLFPHEKIFEMGGFVRHESDTAITVMYQADIAKEIRDTVEAAVNPKTEEVAAPAPVEEEMKEAVKEYEQEG